MIAASLVIWGDGSWHYVAIYLAIGCLLTALVAALMPKPRIKLMSVQRLHVSQRFSEIAIAGNLVHLAGQLATDLNLDIKGQTQQTLDIIDQFLADAGTDKSQIMSVTIYLKDIEKIMQRLMKSGMPGYRIFKPTRTCVEAKLYDPRVLVELTVVAIKPE